MTNSKRQLAVMNFADGNIIIYPLYKYMSDDEIEKYLQNKGYHLNEISWMYSADKIPIIYEDRTEEN